MPRGVYLDPSPAAMSRPHRKVRIDLLVRRQRAQRPRLERAPVVEDLACPEKCLEMETTALAIDMRPTTLVEMGTATLVILPQTKKHGEQIFSYCQESNCPHHFVIFVPCFFN